MTEPAALQLFCLAALALTAALMTAIDRNRNIDPGDPPQC